MAVPERDFYTTDEIVHRWRWAGINHGTLLKLAMDDSLVFSIYIKDLGSHSSTRDTPDGRVTTTQTVVLSFRAEGHARPPLQYLRADDTRRLLESEPSEQIAIRGHYSEPQRTKESGLGYAQPPFFSREDLLVSRLERDRFEKLHRLRLRPPWYFRAWGWLCDQANQRALMMLSGWVAAIVAALWAVWLWVYPNTASPRATPKPSIEWTSTARFPSFRPPLMSTVRSHGASHARPETS